MSTELDSEKIQSQETCQQLLDEIRDRAKKIRSGWANPQYGTNVEEETDYLIEAFEKLDDFLVAGSKYPMDWR